MGFPYSSVGKESACNAGHLGLIPRLGRFPGEGNGNPLQYSCLEIPMDKGAWKATVCGIIAVGYDLVIKPPPIYSVNIYCTPSWTEEPGRLQSMASLESDTTERLHFHFSLSLFTFMHWRRKWQPTPVFLPGEFQGQGSLVGCHLWGRPESDTTEAT